jgi:hypothetical protein
MPTLIEAVVLGRVGVNLTPRTSRIWRGDAAMTGRPFADRKATT